MAKLSITEYRAASDHAPVGAPLAEQVVEFGDEAAFSKPFSSRTHAVLVVADMPCSLSHAGPAVAGLHRLPAERERIEVVEPGGKISVVGSGAGENDDLISSGAQFLRLLSNFTDPAAMGASLATLRSATDAAAAAQAAANEATAAAATATAQAAALGERLADDRGKLEEDKRQLGIDQVALATARAKLDADTADLARREAEIETAKGQIADTIMAHKSALNEDHAARLDDLAEKHDAAMAELDRRRGEIEENTNRALAELNGLKAEAARATVAAKRREDAAAKVEAEYRSKLADITALTTRLGATGAA